MISRCVPPSPIFSSTPSFSSSFGLRAGPVSATALFTRVRGATQEHVRVRLRSHTRRHFRFDNQGKRCFLRGDTQWFAGDGCWGIECWRSTWNEFHAVGGRFLLMVPLHRRMGLLRPALPLRSSRLKLTKCEWLDFERFCRSMRFCTSAHSFLSAFYQTACLMFYFMLSLPFIGDPECARSHRDIQSYHLNVRTLSICNFMLTHPRLRAGALRLPLFRCSSQMYNYLVAICATSP